LHHLAWYREHVDARDISLAIGLQTPLPPAIATLLRRSCERLVEELQQCITNNGTLLRALVHPKASATLPMATSMRPQLVDTIYGVLRDLLALYGVIARALATAAAAAGAIDIDTTSIAFDDRRYVDAIERFLQPVDDVANNNDNNDNDDDDDDDDDAETAKQRSDKKIGRARRLALVDISKDIVVLHQLLAVAGAIDDSSQRRIVDVIERICKNVFFQVLFFINVIRYSFV
jgi:hypothetical protein